MFRRKKVQTPDTDPPSAPPLALRGYVAVQNASYFALPLAPELALFAPDRQLDKLDFRQRTYFDEFRRAQPQCAAVLTQGDPWLALAGIPFGVTLALDVYVPGIGAGWKALAAICVGTLLGPLFIGSLFLWAVRAGVDRTMAFAALAHPGFKHFLRLRVRHDGSAIDVWCIGLRNPLEAGESPVLVDSFCWKARC